VAGSFVIARRFRGPPDSGNGGYSAGMLGVRVQGPATVTLKVPPPLDTILTVEDRPDGALAAVSNGTVVMDAIPAKIDVDIHRAVSVDEAAAAASRYEGFENHAFPMCFVCGPERDTGDGLRIFPGPLDGGGAGGPWTPDDQRADADGNVPPQVVWAALDCPSGWATAYAEPDAPIALLGRLSATLLRPVRAGEPHAAVAWPAGRDGRKHFATSAILDGSGEPCAFGRATWVELRT
jgi:hypothetical protein